MQLNEDGFGFGTGGINVPNKIKNGLWLKNIGKYLKISDAKARNKKRQRLIANKEYVKETFENEISSIFDSKKYPIFSFPLKSSDKKELLENMQKDYNTFRFIANSKNKKLYIFNINLDHLSADRELGINQYNKRRKFEEDYPVAYNYIHYKDNKFYVNSHSIPRGCEFVWKYVSKKDY